jgi:MFS family permease
LQGNNDPDNQTSHGDAGDAGDTSTDQNANAVPQEQGQAPSGTAAALIMVPLCLSVTMSALDLTIVTPAIPAMVSAFQSETGYVWIGSAFILASTASTPVWGSVANIWGRKPIMLISVAVFVLGSLLCALAKNMDALLAGRTIQGLGASGMGTMVNVIICDTFSLRDRGLYLAITSIVWAVASAVGPVVGGIFTTTLR